MTKKIFNLNFLFPLFFIAFLIIAIPVKGQDLCPPSFLEGIPLNGAVELYWDEPDSLGGFGEEVFSAFDFAHHAARFAHDARAGGDIPDIEIAFPESVEPSGGHIGEIKRRGAEPAHAGCFFQNAFGFM